MVYRTIYGIMSYSIYGVMCYPIYGVCGIMYIWKYVQPCLCPIVLDIALKVFRYSLKFFLIATDVILWSYLSWW